MIVSCFNGWKEFFTFVGIFQLHVMIFTASGSVLKLMTIDRAALAQKCLLIVTLTVEDGHCVPIDV